MRRVEHARAEDGKRPITRRRTIGGGNSPAVSRNYGILRDSLELLFLSFSFFFFPLAARKRVWKIRRRRGRSIKYDEKVFFFYLFKKEGKLLTRRRSKEELCSFNG